MRLPGYGRISNKVASAMGEKNKKEFLQYLHSEAFGKDLDSFRTARQKVPVNLATFVDAKNFPDLMLSMLSFVSSVGIPEKWTIYMDDEFPAGYREIAGQWGFITAVRWFENVRPGEKENFEAKWQSRKYTCFANHPVSGTTILLDSDIIFYPRFSTYLGHFKKNNWYLADAVNGFSIDEALPEKADFNWGMYIINSGFMIFNETASWEKGKQYLRTCLAENKIDHFTEQSAINLVYYKDSHAQILDPRTFYTSADDQFTWKLQSTATLALRHYVGLVRFKMWQDGYKKFTPGA